MLASFVITFREFLEATLVMVIVLAYLKRVGQERYFKNVWLGAGVGAGLSVLLAFVFNMAFGGFSGAAEEVFEGILMLVAAVLLTWMIAWMISKRRVAEELEARVAREVDESHALGISVLVAVAVLREGVETVIFLYAASISGSADIAGAAAGAAVAVILGYLLFTGAKRIKIKTFFQATSVLLIFFAAGLTSHALHEFQEAGIISPVIEPLYDITWIINKKGFVGGVLNSLFGYTGKPSLTEMAGYFGYFALTYLLYRQIGRLRKA